MFFDIGYTKVSAFLVEYFAENIKLLFETNNQTFGVRNLDLAVFEWIKEQNKDKIDFESPKNR